MDDAAAMMAPIVTLPPRPLTAAERAALAAARAESPMPPGAEGTVKKKEKKKKVTWPEDDAQLQLVRLFRKVGGVGV